jgi:hypothetical protein
VTPLVKDDDRAWEKELAPRVTRGQVILAGLLFLIWIAVLAVIAANRWFGSLQ